MSNQLDNLIEGKAWVKFSKAEEFVRKDKKNNSIMINRIVDDQKKRLESERGKKH